MWASLNRDIETFTQRLAHELASRLRPNEESGKARKAKSVEAATLRALEHVRAEGASFAKRYKVGLIRRLLITRAFQREMNAQGFKGGFIRDATLVLIKAITPGKR